jgi:hypothetical protein
VRISGGPAAAFTSPVLRALHAQSVTDYNSSEAGRDASSEGSPDGADVMRLKSFGG